MIRCGKILLYVSVALILLWALPWAFNFVNVQQVQAPFILYSGVIDDFASIENKGKVLIRKDYKGNTYSEKEFDSILPMFYYRQLISDNRLPKEIKGVKLDPRIVQTENFMFRNSPEDVNRPTIGLYTLLESSSGRVDLEMPDDVFRITDERIEFIDIASNSVNEKKSELFTDAMLKKGFVFPAKVVAGNPTTHKDYDEGFILVDNANNLFHFKRVVGRPFVRKIDKDPNIAINYAVVNEFRNHKHLAFLTDENNKFYVLLSKSYELIQLPVEKFDPTSQAITIIGNVLDWTIKIADGYSTKFYAVDANNYSLLKQTEYFYEMGSFTDQVQEFMSSWELTFTAPTDKWVKARFGSN